MHVADMVVSCRQERLRVVVALLGDRGYQAGQGGREGRRRRRGQEGEAEEEGDQDAAQEEGGREREAGTYRALNQPNLTSIGVVSSSFRTKYTKLMGFLS